VTPSTFRWPAVAVLVWFLGGPASAEGLKLVGTAVTPHVLSSALRWRVAPDPRLGARVQLFLLNDSGRDWVLDDSIVARLRGLTPNQWLTNGGWTWHDMPSAWTGLPATVPPGAMTVWTLNGKGTNWGAGTRSDLTVTGGGLETSSTLEFGIDKAPVWVTAVNFLGEEGAPFASRLVVHLANDGRSPIRVDGCRLWLPDSNPTWRVLKAQPWLEGLPSTSEGAIRPGGRGVYRLDTGRLPMTYAAVELKVKDTKGPVSSVWAHLRIRKETFDIGGGWIADGLGGSNTLQFAPYLKALRRMHITTGQHGEVPGYTDNSALYAAYPLKMFNRCQPFDRFDNTAMLPRIHGVEFLGEPEYGGGRPVPPMEVWRAFAPYQATRLATTVTHSEERLWRYYAGLSDYPHFDAYRVTAPAADAWLKYDRWRGIKLAWGAPLETIGDMARSLRDLSRPGSVAAWSQGPHDGWESYGGRRRTAPTPDELRAQALQALANRVTSLYWFNLSLKSLVKFRDLIAPVTEINRMIRTIDEILLAGDAFWFERRSTDAGPDWDLSVVAAPDAAVCFALDLAYAPDPVEQVFRFGPQRAAAFHFRLPDWLQAPSEVFRLTPNELREVPFTASGDGVDIKDKASREAVYVVSRSPGLRGFLEKRLAVSRDEEVRLGFDPAGSDADFKVLLDAAR
jgi:hypothetical protein